ncbi:hypothetical protein Taro_032326 [Colocasia esculenta]|uniref:BHLH domain-containing protein n=1 Tax=Colocasia esculenta TaxID=4460 RepID=A0A843VR36_COLES|nr:hypothetical protein [Colocasia esculenta]
MKDSLQSHLLALAVRSWTSPGSSLPRPSSSRMLVRLAVRRRKSSERRLLRGVLIRGCSTGPVPANSSTRWDVHADHVSSNINSTRRMIKCRVRSLQRLVPDGDVVDSLDRLLREAADYIACLQLQVKIMRAMVDVLSAGHPSSTTE